MNRAAFDTETHKKSMCNAFWSLQHDYSKSIVYYFEPFGGLTAFLTLVDFFQKIAFFAIFLLKTPIMNERNYENKARVEHRYNMRTPCAPLVPHSASRLRLSMRLS